jgi:cadmium resistance protein CadD (predicted permease)
LLFEQREAAMRYVNLYLVGYIVFILGVVWALWKVGVFQHVQPIWILIGGVIAIGLGIMTAVGTAKPTITND